MRKFLLLFLCLFSFYSKNIFGDDVVINECLKSESEKALLQKIIEAMGGREKLKITNSAIYETFITINLFGTEVNYAQTIKRKNNLFLLEKKIQDAIVYTGFDGKSVFQHNGSLQFYLSDDKQDQIKYHFKSSMPHQQYLSLLSPSYQLVYKNIQKVDEEDCHIFYHDDVFGLEVFAFRASDYYPVYQALKKDELKWEVKRKAFSLSNGILFPAMTELSLNKELVFRMMIFSVQFIDLEESVFLKPKIGLKGESLDPFIGFSQLEKVYKSLQLFRDYDPVNKSYPDPEKLTSLLGVQPQLGNVKQVIGSKDILFYSVYEKNNKVKKEFEHYPYFLKGDVHPYTPLVWDKKDNYKSGRHVLFESGEIKFINENQFQVLYDGAVKRYPIMKVEKSE